MANDCGQIGRRNIVLAVTAGAISLAAVCLLGVPGVDPSMWEEIAAVAGVRPPHGIFPGIWRLLTGWMFSVFGLDGAIGVLKFLGAAVAGVTTAILCLVIRQVLALLVRTDKPHPVWFERIAPFFAFLGATLFGVGEPLAHTAQVFSSDGLRLLTVLVIVYLTIRRFTVGGRKRLFSAMALMGLLAAESPVGFVLPILFAAADILLWWSMADEQNPQPEKLEELLDMPKWRMFFLFLGGLALGVALNGILFAALGGATANGWSADAVFFHYGIGYWALLKDAASLLGWLLGLAFCLVPFVVALRLSPILLHDDRPMPFPFGVLMFFVGLLALMQTGFISVARFWTFSSASVHSGFLLALFHVCAMMTVALVGAVFAFECQRTYRNRLSEEEMDEEDEIPPPSAQLRGLVPFIGLIVLLVSCISAHRPVESEMQRIVDAAVREIVRECEGIRWLFTDGRLDAGIELEALRQGQELRTLNMMSGASKWEVSVRCRGFEPGSPDFKAAETGVPTLLRVWAGEKTNGMDKVALQLGFEFWNREQKPLPKASGLVAVETGLDDAAAKEGIAQAKEIADRILAISDAVDQSNPSSALAGAFSSANWRISRFARLRKDTETADRLDQANTALTRMLTAIEYERQRTFMQLTPREGLEIALRRANYVEARRYSATVLKNDPDDPQANFALGMSAIMDKRYDEAELYLTRVLKRRPLEPAALNNLSIVCRKQRKYKEAEDYARRAVEVLPNSAEVQNTFKDALKKAP